MKVFPPREKKRFVIQIHRIEAEIFLSLVPTSRLSYQFVEITESKRRSDITRVWFIFFGFVVATSHDSWGNDFPGRIFRVADKSFLPVGFAVLSVSIGSVLNDKLNGLMIDVIGDVFCRLLLIFCHLSNWKSKVAFLPSTDRLDSDENYSKRLLTITTQHCDFSFLSPVDSLQYITCCAFDVRSRESFAVHERPWN